MRDSGGGVLINQAIHTLDLLQWLLGDVVDVRGHTGRYALDGVVDVEDTASVLLDHAGGARSVLFATVANVTDSPVTIEIVTERAVLLIRGDLTVTYSTTGAPRPSPSGGSTPAARPTGVRRTTCSSPTSTAPSTSRSRSGSTREEGTRSLRLIDRIYRLNS